MPDLTITLPLPPRELHAHAKGYWRSKTAPIQACRRDAKLATLAAGVVRFERAVLTARFYWPDNRRRDNANALQSTKAYVDGIVDAGVLADDCWQVLDIGGVTSTVDKANPRVELTITKLENDRE